MEQKRIDRITNVVRNRQRDIIVVLEDIHDPHNAAAILRTCDALGIQNVWFIFEKEKSYNPKRVGKATSSSANKWLDFIIFKSTLQCINTLIQQKYRIVVTALTNESISLADYQVADEKIAIVVGNEHAGISEAMQNVANVVLKIPMMGFVQSLNVSVATAIVLWEITRQRLSSKNPWSLSEKAQQTLLADFLKHAKN